MSNDLQPEAVAPFVELALGCVHREYPSKLGHLMFDDADARPPRELTPAFYGCFDWHSAVHGHWLLARTARLFPAADFTRSARAALSRSFAPDPLAVERDYLRRRPGFERPYGLAWLLALDAELAAWDDPLAGEWRAALGPLVAVAVEHLSDWLPKLVHPVRSGQHSCTAFALGLMSDWARAADESEVRQLVEARAHDLFAADRDYSLHLEPSGEDFLSPSLAACDLMCRVLAPEELARWLSVVLPGMPTDGSSEWLDPVEPTDRADGKLAHLDGLTLSRAWMLEAVAASLPEADPRRSALRACAERHRELGLQSARSEHYAGTHWLGTFAVYLLTGASQTRGTGG